MSNIVIELNDGTVEDFPETSRAGGSYCTSIRYEKGFAIITDAYDRETVFPESRIIKIKVTPSRGYW